MNTEKLPLGSFPASLSFPHFPSKWQAVLWRLWGLVPFDRLARTLGMTEEELKKEGERLGLSLSVTVDGSWLEKSYLTIIRSLWHLLSYGQILMILDWKQEKLLKVFEEEDFFWSKLGRIKPDTHGDTIYIPLTEEEKRRTEKIKALLEKYFPSEESFRKEKIFSFLDDYGRDPLFLPPEKRDLYGFSFNIIHSYAAGCGDVFLDIETKDPVPEELLSIYASLGIKGIWIHAVLHNFYPVKGAEEYSENYQKRMENLKKVAAKCKKYGLELFLYFNEPRSMPMDFYKKFPHWGGWALPDGSTMTMCTNRSKEVLQYLEEGMEYLFTQVKELGGIFCITMSENPTNCFYSNHKEHCPFCKDVPGEKIIADILCAMEKGMHRASPKAKMLAYDWAWRQERSSTDNVPFKKSVLDLLPANMIASSVSEWGKMLHTGGVEVYLKDYSLSQVGPGEEAENFWKHARKRGMETSAKIQMNNSWEISAVPYIPVPYLVQEHLQNLDKEGIRGLILSWTLGGYPGGNLSLLYATPEMIAERLFSTPLLAEKICKAWRIFSESFRNFPFHNGSVLYRSPVNYGPKNLLYLEKTFYTASMLGFPYDDLESWRGPYPEETFIHQFELLTEGWKKGLDLLKEYPLPVTEKEKKAYNGICIIAETVYIHLRSTFLQASFIRERDHACNKNIMKKYVEEELALAVRMHFLASRDSRLGFEASNHYFYTLNDLKEKVISCAYLLERLDENN